MKIALNQINPIIGDFAYNIHKMTDRIAEAKREGCDLAVFPELAVSGYPPEDLLERASFLQDHDAAFNAFVRQAKGIGVICGIITRHTASSGKFLHNSAVLFEDGDILFTAHKRLLPSYDVFDETRYFEPARESSTFVYKGISLGLTICEDIWNDKDLFQRRRYTVDPVVEILAETEVRPDLLINIAASPFDIHKSSVKHGIFTNLCTKYNVPLLYVNQVGGQDSLLFDGQSLAMNSSGEIIACAEMFQEDMLILDTEKKHAPKAEEKKTWFDKDEAATVFDALVMGARDYVAKCGFKKGVLGLSGGIDSALTAAVAAEALGPKNVLGVALPSPYSSEESVEDAKLLAQTLGIDFEIIPITEIFEAQLNTLQPIFAELPHDVTEQNIQARIRGSLLMALANKFNLLLLSTGNKSEMAVGYCTLYGDMNGGLAVISDVPKTLVYTLARHVNREREIIPWRTIKKPPSAELKPDQKDQDDLPPYEILDPILAAYLEENKSIKEITALGFEKAVVEDVVRRIKINEYKRKQAPLGLKVTTKAFGYGRRYPTAQNYVEKS